MTELTVPPTIADAARAAFACTVLYEARRARAELVVRHIALLGEELHPPHDRWRNLLALLPAVSPEHPALKPDVMPDEAIKSVLASCDR